MPTPTPPTYHYHLPTHPLHRPPAQITLPHPHPPPRHSHLSHDPSLPPSQILRLHHLRTMLLTAAAHKAAVRRTQIETDALRGQLLALPGGSAAWPGSTLRAEWVAEQALNPVFAAQAWKAAGSMMEAIAREGIEVVMVGCISERQREVCADGEQLAMILYLRGRYQRLEGVGREVRWVEKRGEGLWNREKGRLRAWVRGRGPEQRGGRGRRVMAMRAAEKLGESRGLGLGRMTAEGADAYRWGEMLRRRTVMGEMRRGEWPCQGAFEVYKWRRYEASGQRRPWAVSRYVTTAYPYRMALWPRGGSPLKVFTARSMSSDGDSDNQGKKRKREESDHGPRRTSPAARDRKHM